MSYPRTSCSSCSILSIVLVNVRCNLQFLNDMHTLSNMSYADKMLFFYGNSMF